MTAKVGDIELKKQVSESGRSLSAIDKCRYLYDLSLIDQSQYIRSLCEAIQSGEDWGLDEDCGTLLISEILSYAETMSEDNPYYNTISSVAYLSEPQYTDHKIYPAENSGAHFYVHYGTISKTSGETVTVGSLNAAKG